MVSLHQCQFTAPGSCRVKVWSVETQLRTLKSSGSVCVTLSAGMSHPILSFFFFFPVRSSTRGMCNTSRACFDIHACQDGKRLQVAFRLVQDFQQTFTHKERKKKKKQTWLESSACKLEPSFDTVYLHEWKVHVVSVLIRNLCNLFTST